MTSIKKQSRPAFHEFLGEADGQFKVRVGQTIYIVEPHCLTANRFKMIHPGFSWLSRTKVIDRKTQEIRALTVEDLQKEWLTKNLQAVVNQNVRRSQYSET